MPMLITLILNQPFKIVRLRCAFIFCQYSLKVINVCLIAFMMWSILTQKHPRPLNHIQEMFTLTQRHSYALNYIQRVFSLTQSVVVHTHSKAFKCTQLYSRGVQSCSCSLNSVRVHSIAFEECAIHSCSLYASSNIIAQLNIWKFTQFPSAVST